MKRLFCLLPLFVILLLPATPMTAHAESASYAVAASNDVWFYSKPDEESGLFVLPYTYYVHVMAMGEDFCAVEYLEDSAPYQKLKGYCKTDALTFVDFVPARPYLRLEIPLTYVIDGDFPALGGSDLSTMKVAAVYYGTKTFDGTLALYVYANGVFGYVPARAEPEYEHNTDYLTAAPAEPSAAVKGTGLSAGHIVAIVLACVVSVVISALLLRGKLTSRKEEAVEF